MLFNRSKTYEERVDTVLQWLSWDDKHRPDLITLFMDEPDHTGHGHGPDSPEVSSNTCIHFHSQSALQT